jgi:hypothetical protein
MRWRCSGCAGDAPGLGRAGTPPTELASRPPTTLGRRLEAGAPPKSVGRRRRRGRCRPPPSQGALSTSAKGSVAQGGPPNSAGRGIGEGAAHLRRMGTSPAGLETEEVEVELTLGLSLSGRFGPDRSRLPGCRMHPGAGGGAHHPRAIACILPPEETALAPPAALAMTSSLPYARLPPSSAGDAPTVPRSPCPRLGRLRPARWPPSPRLSRERVGGGK